MTTITDPGVELSDRAVSILRTAVPALWGAVVAALLRALAPQLPAAVYEALADALSSEVTKALVVALVIAAWYALWRRLEPLIPDWLTRLVLGSARTPAYAETTSDGAAVITDVTSPPGYEVAEVSDAKTDVADLLGTEYGGYDDPPTLDTIAAADHVVEELISKGWRPTT